MSEVYGVRLSGRISIQLLARRMEVPGVKESIVGAAPSRVPVEKGECDEQPQFQAVAETGENGRTRARRQELMINCY